jgi:hypothetical protein
VWGYGKNPECNYLVKKRGYINFSLREEEDE